MQPKYILVNYMGRNNSGPLIALEIAKSLKHLGYKVYAIISKHVSNHDDWYAEKIDGIYEVDTYQSKKDLISKSIYFTLKEKQAIKAFFKSVHIDIIIKPLFHPWANMVSALFDDARIVTYCHDPIMHSGVSKLEQLLYKTHIMHSDDIVVLTKSFIPIVEKNYGFPKSKIHYSIHGKLGTYKEKQSETCPDPALLYDNNKVNFLFFGRIQHYKGLHILAKAYKMVSEQYDDITLTVMGAGDFSDYADEYSKLKNTTIINRYIDDSEVGWGFTGDNIVTILPYINATQSGVTPLAIEYGVPIIASDIGGLKEQLYDGEIGVFFKVNDAEDLANKMAMFIENKKIYLEQREKMHKKMEELDWSVIMEKLMKELDNN